MNPTLSNGIILNFGLTTSMRAAVRPGFMNNTHTHNVCDDVDNVIGQLAFG